MDPSDNPVGHLLWCILVALRTADENHNITSETGKRKFINEWLNGASRRVAAFQGLNKEIASVRELLQTDKSVSIDSLLYTLWVHAIASDKCDLFRFRAVINALFSQGWCHYYCRGPEEALPEIMERQKSGKRHILQFTRMEEAFSPTGTMTSAITMQLVLKKKNDVQVEQSFYFDKFCVFRGREIKLPNATVRTLYIGHHALPESAWGARAGDLWKPSLH